MSLNFPLHSKPEMYTLVLQIQRLGLHTPRSLNRDNINFAD